MLTLQIYSTILYFPKHKNASKSLDLKAFYSAGQAGQLSNFLKEDLLKMNNLKISSSPVV
ncbi:hypothetical protein DCC81_05760 [Chitinophaga parva]|uniref:Uncharacterized protein n=1 Tax=Chitinophaga parva TaxID=2169414 RepID=A0A2T7BMT5_9BACT|nr:hypothetical protein DCC81_05760 [Chitinophaga parva]